MGRGRFEQDRFDLYDGEQGGHMTQEPLNREQRRHPEKTDDPAEEASLREQANEVFEQDRPQDVSSTRAKNSRHKKVTADNWNQ